MMVQVYDDGPARVFPTRESTMVCELNARTKVEADAALAKLHLARRGKWQQTEWGWEAKLETVNPKSNAR